MLKLILLVIQNMKQFIKLVLSTISKDAKFKINFSDYLNNKGEGVTKLQMNHLLKLI